GTQARTGNIAVARDGSQCGVCAESPVEMGWRGSFKRCCCLCLRACSRETEGCVAAPPARCCELRPALSRHRIVARVRAPCTPHARFGNGRIALKRVILDASALDAHQAIDAIEAAAFGRTAGPAA